MDGSFREQGSGKLQASKSFIAGLQILSSLISWLADLIKLAEEEREAAGVHLHHLGGQ